MMVAKLGIEAAGQILFSIIILTKNDVSYYHLINNLSKMIFYYGNRPNRYTAHPRVVAHLFLSCNLKKEILPIGYNFFTTLLITNLGRLLSRSFDIVTALLV